MKEARNVSELNDLNRSYYCVVGNIAKVKTGFLQDFCSQKYTV